MLFVIKLRTSGGCLSHLRIRTVAEIIRDPVKPELCAPTDGLLVAQLRFSVRRDVFYYGCFRDLDRPLGAVRT